VVITPQLPSDSRIGYDGQFAFYIAADPANARYYMRGEAGYRYPRILYPMLARALALGRAGAIPYTLVAINVGAVGAAVLALALWLRRRATSTWLALLYAAFPAVGLCVACDLTEPLAYALALLGVVVLDRRGRHAVPAAASLFALATLARETTAVFPAVYALALLVGGDGPWRARIRANGARAAVFAASSLVPLVMERIAFRLWLGAFTTAYNEPSPWPFAGIVSWWPWDVSRWLVVLAVVVPALAWALAALLALRRRLHTPELWLVAVNVVLFVVFLPAAVFFDYGAAARASVGTVAAAIMSYPALRALRLPKRRLDALVLAWSPLSLAIAVVVVAAAGA
jgi:hypothetical protein